MRHTIIVNKRRFYSFVFLVALLLSLLLTLISAFLSDKQVFGMDTYDGREYIVQAGDSVWNIAGPIAEQSKRDIRDVVRDIYRSNDLAGKTIHPGQSLYLPLH